MTAAAELKIDRLRAWIGREDMATDLVSAELVRRFRATFDQPPDDLQPGRVAPRLLHFCLGQPAAPTGRLSEDGHPQRGGFLPPVPLPRRMWAGGSLVFHDDLRIGDTMRRVSRIVDLALKNGRSGALCFVTVKHEIDVGGRPILSETQEIVYRGPDGGEAKKAPSPAAEGRHRCRVDPSSPFLFRYSALTFNGHRIHYDHPYATEVEGYPGLVVHGPLQATLLLNFATGIRGTAPVRFSFRSLSPLFDNEALHLHAEEDSGRLKLWTARAGGPPAMTADAAW